jgi:hypothetical protein
VILLRQAPADGSPGSESGEMPGDGGRRKTAFFGSASSTGTNTLSKPKSENGKLLTAAGGSATKTKTPIERWTVDGKPLPLAARLARAKIIPSKELLHAHSPRIHTHNHTPWTQSLQAKRSLTKTQSKKQRNGFSSSPGYTRMLNRNERERRDSPTLKLRRTGRRHRQQRRLSDEAA